jgi:hypothetical protein
MSRFSRFRSARSSDCWLAGAGLKSGFAYGDSDELGFKPAANPVSVYDLHATLVLNCVN